MKVINLKSSNLDSIFKQLNLVLGGQLHKKIEDYALTLNNDNAFGTISGISLKDNIYYMEFDLVMKRDVLLVNNMPLSKAIYFTYCSAGQLLQSFGLNGDRVVLNKFQTGIFYNNSDKDTVFLMQKAKSIKVSFITVSTYNDFKWYNLENDSWSQLINIFSHISKKENFVYVGSYNLKIAEKIQQLGAIKQKGIVRKLLIKGIIHVILAMEIQQHRDDINHIENNNGSLTCKEMESINELSLFIKNYPEKSFNLKYLSTRSGMPPSKLQEGFKRLHGKTVTNYIRNVRVEAAEHLIKTTDLNISEVVYSVGLTSRSYFSKIFKKKYNCSPKKYQENQDPMVLV